MSLHQTYEKLVNSGELHFDHAQTEAIHLLEQVETELTAAPEKKGFFDRFKAEEPVAIKGVYMWGGVGRGKSMLMDLFFEHSEIELKRRVHFHAFMQEIHAGMHEARKTSVDDAIVPVADAVIAQAKLLCFDEMQITDITDAMIVGRLFERLFDAGVVVVTTSNRPPDDLYKDGLNRNLFLAFIKMIKDELTVHELVSETDYRQHRLAGSQVYFHPADAEAQTEINNIFQDLVGEVIEPLTLRVKGRDVVLPEFGNGVARASFFELCGKPLGAADYLAIAEAVRVLVLENIPCLSRSNFNEAKRFVTLIDALYEAKVKLICSAADRPERLYLEGEGVFEFERTASRLREMQAEDWGRD